MYSWLFVDSDVISFGAVNRIVTDPLDRVGTRPVPSRICSGLPVPSVGQPLAHQVGHDLQEVLQVSVGQELPAHGLVRGQPHLLGPLGEEQ